MPISQGFKIHVSAAPTLALNVLDAVVPVCVADSVEFKIAGDPEFHTMLDGKQYERGASGKFMTIYPRSIDHFSELIESLYRSTRNEPLAGPRILSDRRYRDSRILSYRYGGFYSPRRVRIDGTHEMMLVTPEGEYVPDERLPYFQLPPWVNDPFSKGSSSPDGASVILGDRYEVESAYGFSNSGGLYYGTDIETGAPVFIKEARPLTNCLVMDGKIWDSPDHLCHEFEMLELLRSFDWTPDPLACFKEGEHTFIVQNRINGIRLRQYWARADLLLTPYIRSPARLKDWLPVFRHVAETLIFMVTEVHRRGVLLGDLAPDNVLIDPQTRRMWLVDFESSITEDDDAARVVRATMWGTPGFVNPRRHRAQRLMPEDDFYAAGMILYAALCAIDFFELNPPGRDLFLDKFVSLGLPSAVRSVITSLLDGKPDRATEALKSLPRDTAGERPPVQEIQGAT
ncbi:hypothetical protein ACFCV8_23810 [Streptomyces sp. NPDC056347]|uniref:class III lanthionine synthetase LanKC N-terminal domain-containing protein n=1 Tax=Streptomyces sp. NPDC056347 TaxID=3345790 RepID=UPI0035E16128